MSFDLTEYLIAIGLPEQLAPPLNPSVETLYLVVNRHVMSIPYQNFELFLKQKPDLSAQQLQQSLVRDKLGGMCYQTSELLYHALREIQFDVKVIPAFPLNNKAFNPDVPSTHNILLIEIGEQSFLADVGYGYNSLRYPIKLKPDQSQEITLAPNEKYQLLCGEDYYQLNLDLKGSWFTLYRFDRPIQTINSERTLSNCNELLTYAGQIPIRDTYVKVSKLTNEGRIGFHLEPRAESIVAYKMVIKGSNEVKDPYTSIRDFADGVHQELGLTVPTGISP
jgi:arylamine N-acetyltransferase